MRDLRGLGSCMIGLVCSNLCLDLKSDLSVDRHYIQAGKNLEFAIRDWATETGSVVCRDDVHITGIFRLFFVHRLVLTHSSVNTFHRQHSRTTIRPNRTYRPTADRLRRQMGPISVPLRSRGGIRAQPPRGVARELLVAAGPHGNQESAVDV